METWKKGVVNKSFYLYLIGLFIILGITAINQISGKDSQLRGIISVGSLIYFLTFVIKSPSWDNMEQKEKKRSIEYLMGFWAILNLQLAIFLGVEQEHIIKPIGIFSLLFFTITASIIYYSTGEKFLSKAFEKGGMLLKAED